MIEIPAEARPGIRWLRNGLAAHELPRPQGLVEVDVVLDLGCGIRPIDWYKPRRHVCVDAHKPYVDRVAAVGGYYAVHSDALTALRNLKPGQAEAIYCLDMIEHLTREDGLTLIQLAQMAQPKQIVIFTPNGYHEQNGPDPWGLGGDHWQKHRSGWNPEDFPGWWIEFYGHGFMAVWTSGSATILSEQTGLASRQH